MHSHVASSESTVRVIAAATMKIPAADARCKNFSLISHFTGHSDARQRVLWLWNRDGSFHEFMTRWLELFAEFQILELISQFRWIITDSNPTPFYKFGCIFIMEVNGSHSKSYFGHQSSWLLDSIQIQKGSRLQVNKSWLLHGLLLTDSTRFFM